ncbi:MAG: extracellular solute-binding protein [Vallitaleaceae bacterium]|nr:extracellular solute-binding protein [Vallitaleaceae bacterium]
MKAFSKMVAVLLMFVLLASMVGCGQEENINADESGNGEVVLSEAAETSEADEMIEISFLNSKNDINDQIISATEKFKEKHPNISINVLSTDQSPVERASTLYASGTPATLVMLDSGDIKRFSDKALDLSGEKWVQDLAQESLIDGKVLGFPFAVEGYGLIYNQEVLDKAVGGTFDPSTINTQDALEDLFKKIQATGVEALAIGSMNWSLGNHFLAIAYATQDGKEVDEVLNELKAGEVKFADNMAYQGLMDTFDIMKNYNMAKNDPMAYDYPESLGPVARGEAGITFNGNWAILEIQKSNPDGKFGFIPVPISNDGSDPRNNAIAIGSTKQIFIDKEGSTQAQQDAAKLFLDWIVYDQDGQDFMVNEANIVMGFTNVEMIPSSPLAQAIVEYNNAGKSIAFAGNYVPANHWEVLGATMQKYLVDKIDRETVAQEVEQYWLTVE